MKVYVEFRDMKLSDPNKAHRLDLIKNAEAILSEIGYDFVKITDPKRDSRLWIFSHSTRGLPMSVFGIDDLTKEGNENESTDIDNPKTMDVEKMLSDLSKRMADELSKKLLDPEESEEWDEMPNDGGLIDGDDIDEMVTKTEILQMLSDTRDIKNPVERLYAISEILLDHICDDDFDDIFKNVISDIIESN